MGMAKDDMRGDHGACYRLEHLSTGLVAVTFIGAVPIAERLRALEALEETARESLLTGYLVDFSQATITGYGAADALRLAEKVARDRPSFGKVAYVLRDGQMDMVAGFLSALHGNRLVRRFADRPSAVAWLTTPAD